MFKNYTSFWEFGDFKHYTSLKLMAHGLGIPSPNEDIDRSMVRDVVTVAQVFLRLRNEELLREDQIV